MRADVAFEHGGSDRDLSAPSVPFAMNQRAHKPRVSANTEPHYRLIDRNGRAVSETGESEFADSLPKQDRVVRAFGKS